MKTSGLDFDLRWSERVPSGTAGDATWGSLRLLVDGELVWGVRSGEGFKGIEWTWIDLLEWLAQTWSWIRYEESWPCGISVGDPRDFDTRLRETLEAQPEEARLSAAQAFFEFRERHDLSRALPGATVPTLWVVKEGASYWISSATNAHRVPAELVLDALDRLGVAIAARVQYSDDERAKCALDDWHSRAVLSSDEGLSIVTGLSSDLLRTLENRRVDFEVPDSFAPTEIMAAARMAAGSSVASMVTILGEIANTPAVGTEAIDHLSGAALAIIAEASGAPHDQGYSVAQWLRREHLKVADDARVDPDAVLEKWGVSTAEVDFQSADIDAVATWGPRHGPAIILNSQGPHMESAAGRRATLAHEIAHLLLDRFDALPLAEVLGGLTPRIIEQRARAFAAELLVPRSVAGASFSGPEMPREALNNLRGRYRASDEIIAWQARNSGQPLSREAHDFLRSCVSTPHRF